MQGISLCWKQCTKYYRGSKLQHFYGPPYTCVFLGVATWNNGGSWESGFNIGAWSSSTGAGSARIWRRFYNCWADRISRQTLDVTPPVGYRCLGSSEAAGPRLQLFPSRLDESCRMDRTGQRTLRLAEWWSSFGQWRDPAAEQCPVIGWRCCETKTGGWWGHWCRVSTPGTCRYRPCCGWTADEWHWRTLDITQSAYVQYVYIFTRLNMVTLHP